MIMTFAAFLGSLELGMIYAVLALGVFLSFRTLNMPDLTVDGTLPLGAVITAVLIRQGVNPWLCLLVSFAGGMLAGFAFGEKRLPRKPMIMGIFGFFGVLLFVGPLLDTCTVFLTVADVRMETAIPIYVSGFPVNLSQGACTFLTMLLFGRPLLEKLDRIQEKYGMMEGEYGL